MSFDTAPQIERFSLLLKRHWSKALTALLVIITLFVWGERLSGRKKRGSRQDFFQASQISDRFQRGELLDRESVEMWQRIIDTHPELHSYETQLARAFFAQSDLSQGLYYASDALERNLKELDPAYVQFGRASLLIAEGKKEEALAMARSLQAESGSMLEALNLLRLAMLGEHGCWEQLRAHSRFSQITSLFHEGEVDASYFSER